MVKVILLNHEIFGDLVWRKFHNNVYVSKITQTTQSQVTSVMKKLQVQQGRNWSPPKSKKGTLETPETIERTKDHVLLQGANRTCQGRGLGLDNKGVLRDQE